MFVGRFQLVVTLLQAAISIPHLFQILKPVELNYKCVESHRITRNNSPVLLVHGLLNNLWTWNVVAQGLADRTGRMICAVDLRNHGDSPWNDRADVHAMTADIYHLLDKLRIRKVNIIGHSLGGKVAVDFTLNNPERVNSVVIEDIQPNNIPESILISIKMGLMLLKEAIQTVPQCSKEDEAIEIIYNYMRRRYTELGFNPELAKDYKVNPSNIECMEWCQYKFNIEALAEVAKYPTYFLKESKGVYYGPTLFIYGEKSPFDVSGDKEEIMELFPHAIFVEIKDAKHRIHKFFKQFQDEVIYFLNNMHN